MNLDRVTPGRDLPDDFNVIIEIPMNAEHYKDLEPGKWVKVAGWLGPEEARAEIVASVARYREATPKPMF
jgi:inorganic pyrophosphatase